MYKKYVLKLFIFTILIGLIGAVLFLTFFKNYYLPVFPWLLIFFFLITFLAHIFLLIVTKRNISRFASMFMLFSMLKMLVYIIFIVIYLLINRDNTIPFLITFFSGYLLFSIFEVKSFISYQKNQIKSK